MGRRRGQRKGYLYRKSGFWYLQYRIDTLDLLPSGKPKRERITVQVGPSKGPEAIGKREAERQAHAEFLSKVDVGAIRPGSMITLQDFVDKRWRPDVLGHLKPSGKLFYETQLRNHVLPFLGTKKLREISLAHVQDIINKRSKTHSPRTCECICSCISSIFRHARRMDCYAGPLPIDGIRKPEVVEHDPKTLTWEQVEEISRAAPEPLSTLIQFLTITGLRIGEACGLRWEHVDVEGLVVHVRENWVMGKRGTPKSKKSRRDVPLDQPLALRLAALRESSKFPEGEHPVFGGTTGSPLDHHNAIARTLKPILEDMGLKWVAWHTFRRTNSTLAERAGFTVSQRQRILGHADARVTMRYTAADLETARSGMGKIRRVN